MTNTDAQFQARFTANTPTLTMNSFVANQSTLQDWTPSSSVINTGLLSDIGRAMVYNVDVQDSFYDRFMTAPLGRGDSVMSMRVGEVSSRAYDPNAADSELFNGQYAGFTSNVAKKNLSRQIATEINDQLLAQYSQTEDMQGDLIGALMSGSYACYKDDMWTAGKSYFSGSTRNARATQMVTMTNGITDAGFGAELIENLWTFQENDFAYKSTNYNAAGMNVKSDSVHIALKKSVAWPAFRKLYSETFNPEFIRVANTIDYVDDFATPAGAPSDAGELIGMIVDNRAFKITPMPGGITTEAFRNPARRSTAYFTTYEYAFQHDPFFNIGYIFAPQ